MAKALWLLVCMCLSNNGIAQTVKPIRKINADSLSLLVSKEEVNDMPVIALNENERSESNIAYIPSVLYANRDVFMSVAGFHFSVTRFRMRGYEADLFNTQINGLPMNNLDDGNTQWSLWTGLNDVTRNAQMIVTLRPADQSFGSIGNTVHLDMRASKQWAQTQYSYSFANRSYAHRLMYSKATPFTKKRWAFSFSGSIRVAAMGYMPGTYYKGGSYFVGADKKWNDAHLLSVILFGNLTENGKQGPVVKESVALGGSSFYNPYWGYQGGKIRNANIGKQHQPVLIITDDHRINNHTSLITTMGYVHGNKSSTALDWYKASDPRPDYYRSLPGYQKDSVLQQQMIDRIKEDPSLLQINWDRFYETNKNSFQTLNNADGTNESYSGLRAHYLLEERVSGMQRLSVNTVFNTRLNELLAISAGASVQLQETHNYKKIHDLLGSEYTVDWNQFAERDFPGNTDAIQNDLNHPNHVLHLGDVYGYDYTVNTTKMNAWIQFNASGKKLDFFYAAEISYTNYFRDGRMRNGLFPYNSYGRSEPCEFGNYAIKAGATYKINGRKYLYLHSALMSRPPLFDNVFISPRTRDTKQEQITSENIYTSEAGYIWNAPKIKMRLTTYLTGFSDGMNVLTFYHDGYGNFVNYALSGINRLHYGTELGVDYKLTRRFNLIVAAAMGRYYYTSRQQVSVTADNDATVLERELIYSKNYRVGGTPQEAYSVGLRYQSKSGSFYANISGNYFREQWLDINPLRRTYSALDNVTEKSEQWNTIIAQEKLPEQYTIDLSGGGSFRVKLFGAKKYQSLVYNISIGNLLDKKDIISGGYEQLRFDVDEKNIAKFPPKYFYAMGLNFSINCALRL